MNKNNKGLLIKEKVLVNLIYSLDTDQDVGLLRHSKAINFS